MYYDSKLSAYVINASDLKNYSIDYINSFKDRLIIEASSTRGMSSRFLTLFTNPNVSFHVRGGYTKEKADYWNKKNMENPSFKRGHLGIPGVCYLEDCNIYSLDEMKSILAVIEKIEDGIDTEWSDIKKALYIYDKLREEIIYHPKFEKEESYNIRSLRGLISKKSVCAGYALIFKEMMDRQGIACDCVFGFVDEKEKHTDNTSHLWNLLNINGKIIPIDLTWDASGYRQGDKNSFSNFAYVEKFKRTHFPHRMEKIQDYSTLHGLKEGFVRETIDGFKKKKEYTQSIVSIMTSDNCMVDVAQVYSYQLSGTKQKIYRYVVAERDKQKGHINYKMVYSKTNLLEIYSKYQKSMLSKDSWQVRGVSTLFAPSSMDEALKKGSNYIGELKTKNGSFYIERDERVSKRHPTNFVERVRSNERHFLVGESLVRKTKNKKVLHYGTVLEFDAKKRRLVEYKLCSEKDFLSDASKKFVDEFLDFSRLDKRVADKSGYVGMIEDGSIMVDADLDSFFDKSNSGDISEDDFVKPGDIENRNGINKIGFDQLRDISSNYMLRCETSSFDFKPINRHTGNEVVEPSKRIIVAFADIWLSAAGSKYFYSDGIPGMFYAFNDGSCSVYDFLQNKCIAMIEKKGEVDFSKLTDAEMRKDGYGKYKYTYEILEKLFKTPQSRQLVQDFFGLQAEVFKNERVQDKIYSSLENDFIVDGFVKKRKGNAINGGNSNNRNASSNSDLDAMFSDECIGDEAIIVDRNSSELENMFSLENKTIKAIVSTK